MVWLPLIWICLASMTLGCGLLVVSALVRFGGATFRAPLSTFQVFWFGYAFLIAVLQVCSTLVAVRRPVAGALMVCAVLGYAAQRRAVRLRLLSWWSRRRFTLGLLLSGLVTLALVAGRAAQKVGWYDTHLYHLHVVKWARTYAAVPGIANLHYRLAYNNSVHMFGALCDVFYAGRASHIANGLLVMVAVVQLAAHVLRPSQPHARLLAGFALLTLPFILGGITGGELASLSSDLPLNLFAILTVSELLAWRGDKARQDLRLALALSLAAVAVTTKLGGLGLLAVTGLAAVVVLVRRADRMRCAFALAALPALLLTSHMARQVIMSGWLLFPAPIGNLHLSWSLPEVETLDQFRWIQSWSRMPGREPADVLDHGFAHWFGSWFENHFAGSQECVVLLFAIALSLVRLAQPRGVRLPWHPVGLAAAVASLVLWFRGAPDLRFGAGFFWTLLAVIGAPLLAELLKERSGPLLGLALGLALTAWTGGLSVVLPSASYWTRLPRINVPPLKQLELSPGLTVQVPLGSSDRCGNAPLPCTPYPAHQRLRRANDLSAGFLY